MPSLHEAKSKTKAIMMSGLSEHLSLPHNPRHHCFGLKQGCSIPSSQKAGARAHAPLHSLCIM